MRNKILLALVMAGILGGLVSAYVSNATPKPPPPVFSPAPDPFARGVYANGIVESYQSHGNNTNVYPVVAGTVTSIRVTEGQRVTEGDVLLTIDDSVQRATTEQLRAQAAAATSALDELRAQPRPENLAVAAAQVELARANLKTARSQLAIQRRAYRIDPRAVSKLTLDTATNTVSSASASLDVARRQYDLTLAGAWSYDIENQEHQVEALTQSYEAAKALLDKYTIHAPRDGIVLQIQTAVGSYVSSQGVYNPYTQLQDPILVMGDTERTLAVRCFVDETLIPRLPDSSRLTATMFVRGTNTRVPLEFVRVQPYVTPKIELSNARTEKVDLRVLPVIFRFTPPPGTSIYPGQLVDVYLGEAPAGGEPGEVPERAASRPAP